MDFRASNSGCFDSEVIGVCLPKCNSQQVSTWPGNDLAPNWRQSITRVNSDAVCWRIYVSLQQYTILADQHCNDVIMGAIAYQVTSLTIVYPIVYSDVDQRKHQSSAALAFGWGIHRGPVNSPHKWPVTRKMFPFDDVIMVPQNIIYGDQPPLYLLQMPRKKNYYD